jgi:hypothetical protein
LPRKLPFTLPFKFALGTLRLTLRFAVYPRLLQRG